jgi:predicted metal-dependent phosphotriesterase family hydrolase
VRNCQDWIVDFVEKLTEEGYLDAAAREMVRDAPKKM